MSHEKLTILPPDKTKNIESQDQEARNSIAAARREILQKIERKWLIDPTSFSPMKNIMQKKRIEQTWKLIEDHLSIQGTKVADLGCGYGILARKLRDQGAQVDAVEASQNALKFLKDQEETQGIHFIHDALPNTKLSDDHYDLVLCTEVIAELDPHDFRLCMSELARIVKMTGFAVISTDIDIYSIDALERFVELIKTEFDTKTWSFSHHYLLIKLLNGLKIPKRYVQATYDPEIRYQQLKIRKGFSRWWFKLNTNKVTGILWKIISWPLELLIKLFEKSNLLMRILEKISEFIWSDSGISHVIVLGQRRPLISEISHPDGLPKEPKHKKQLWE